MVRAEMMRTPWGDARQLRERELVLGRGASAEDRARNQRERLFAAAILATASEGYAAVRVADLLELAGVSRATFYQHFEDKGHCFREAVAALFSAGLGELKRALLQPGDWEQRALAGVQSLVEMSVAQPTATKVSLVDAYTAGDDGVAPLHAGLREASGITHALLRRLPRHGETPPELARATVGGLHRVLYRHLERGEEERLQGRAEELLRWAMCFPAGSLTAARRRRGRRGQASEPERRLRSDLGDDTHERILRGFAAAVAERGYAATTVSQVAARASISQSTFYEHFKGKEDAMAAALDLSGAQLLAAALPAARRAPEWPQALRTAVSGLCRYLANEPQFAHLRAVETYAAGPPAVALRDAAFEQVLAEFLPAEAKDGSFALAMEASIGAVHGLIYDAVRAGGPRELNTLVPLASYVLLCPLLGAAEAAEVASRER